jgi:thiamine biosynthesis protein ThiS
MDIILNNRKENIDADQLTVNALIKYKNFTFKLLVTKVNGKLVRISERDDVMVKDGDKVDVLHLISGG